GAQSYSGRLVLDGNYEASDFQVNGATTLGGSTTIASGGRLDLGAVSGAQALMLSGGTVTLGKADVGTLSVSGDSIATSGVTTTGAQRYAGATTLSGSYGASDFIVDGDALLLGDTAVAARGAATFGQVDGAHGWAVVASTAVLGAVGQDTALGAVRIAADETVLDTTSAFGDIEVAAHLVGTTSGEQSVAFVTGRGETGDGDIRLGNVGTDSVRLGDLSVTGGDFSASTVKIAGDFTSLLGGSQTFSAQTLDALGNVNATVA